MTLENNRAPLQCYCKLCASFHSHWCIQIWVTVRKRPISGQIRRFLEPCDLEIWWMTLKNNRAPLLSNIKLYASFHHHMWIQTGVTVRKRLSWVVTLTFDLWPWPFAWTLLWSLVITPENFMMIPWWEHSQKGVTDRRTENTICRAAWSQLKIQIYVTIIIMITIATWLTAHYPYPQSSLFLSWELAAISCQSHHPVFNFGDYFQPHFCHEVSEMHLHLLAIDTISRDLFSWLLFLPGVILMYQWLLLSLTHIK